MINGTTSSDPPFAQAVLPVDVLREGRIVPEAKPTLRTRWF